MEVKKGLFFSLDVAFATVIAIIFIVGILFNLDKSQEGKFEELYLSKLANDVLVTLDKNGMLETLDKTLIENTIKDVLPDNLAFKLNVTVYQCANQDCTTFDNVAGKNILITGNSSEENSVIAKRSFLTFKSSRIEYFPIAELRVWLI